MVKVKYRRHYVDYEEVFKQLESAFKFVEQLDTNGAGFASEILVDDKRVYTRYRPESEGWVDSNGYEVSFEEYRDDI